ncbi:energy-coupling factor ABC transporter substrate-binding protein [Anabaena sp. FACHB-709]|uniref:Cobalt transport protein CbiN n=3 Tax=Nostocaceae TaxID=1162 RepID=CBIN_NOSS1|nr:MULTISPECIES: energy-coupling factor ABC transporter substrate-binding protein [Nostocaceae]Q8YQ90.1 RecName: Full=Cobalt transport protein CbiN; AltName: Full=Energy-coupling factor transporter probable substrate-capture protein CbiN; Short=ECF transporter S component CbiN [Nostoc sp. PCC 7120 = FACHB-418]BAY69571.1 cobalt transport protein CbiN [Trichormus variabilis NIES-23]HBW31753.1 energy-coupling factor ABC transporter substrate-binding protein [Nostoc sp. UBA8866]MBD2170964.1 energy-
MNQSKQSLSNWLLIGGVIALAVLPLIFVRDAEFTGADSQAEKAISEVKPGYEPWFKPLFEPPSGEVESLLFSSQAALGAGIIGYAVGLYKGRSQQQRHKE